VTLQRYLSRLVGLCIVPMLVLVGALGYLQLERARDSETGRAQRLATRIAIDVDQWLANRTAGLHMLALSPLVAQPASWRELHAEAVRFREGFGGQVALVDAERRTVLHTSVPFGGPLPALPQPAGRAAVPLAFDSGRMAVGDPFLGPIAKEALVALAMPLQDPARPMVLAHIVPTRLLQPQLDQIDLPPRWQLVLRDSRGQVFLSRGDTATDAADVLRYAQTLSRVPWAAEVRVPRSSYLGQVLLLGALLLVAVLAATGLSVLTARWATRRLKQSVHALVDLSPLRTPVAGEVQEMREARALLDHSLRQRDAAAQALALREQQLARILESASDAILTVDEQQRVVMANSAAAHVFGRPVEELVGGSLSSLLPERYRSRHRAHVEHFGSETAALRVMGSQRQDVVGLRADGQEFPVEASISKVQLGERRCYTVIVRDVSRRRQLEAQLRASHAELARLVVAQQAIEEEERKRIARELHDDLQQVLAAIKMDVGAIEAGLGADRERLLPLVTRADNLATAAIVSSRRIVNDLRPQLLEELGLVPALEVLARQFAERSGVEVAIESDAASTEPQAVPAAVALCLYRVAQEALNNVAKHAQARRVRIELRAIDAGGWRLRVADDGVGLQQGDRLKPGSFGLRGMAERVRALGGDLRLEATPGGGVTLVVEVGDRLTGEAHTA
jgi:PAS domain S-box-containing protein